LFIKSRIVRLPYEVAIFSSFTASLLATPPPTRR
jgi:hypothetical protein